MLCAVGPLAGDTFSIAAPGVTQINPILPQLSAWAGTVAVSGPTRVTFTSASVTGASAALTVAAASTIDGSFGGSISLLSLLSALCSVVCASTICKLIWGYVVCLCVSAALSGGARLGLSSLTVTVGLSVSFYGTGPGATVAPSAGAVITAGGIGTLISFGLSQYPVPLTVEGGSWQLVGTSTSQCALINCIVTDSNIATSGFGSFGMPFFALCLSAPLLCSLRCSPLFALCCAVGPAANCTTTLILTDTLTMPLFNQVHSASSFICLFFFLIFIMILIMIIIDVKCVWCSGRVR